jgi:hypothetical protein
MRKVLKKLLSLWLVWSIALLPVQTFGALPAPATGEPCMMHGTVTGHPHGSEQAGHPDTSQAPCSSCKSCDQHDCDGDACAAGSCASMQLQPAILSLRLAERYRAAARGSASPASGLVSRTDPPPLPPPV